MTGRVCLVHGEYAPDGVCRWCEASLPVVITARADGSPPKEWFDTPATVSPPMCICAKCLRGFDAPIPLTSLLCPERRGKQPPTYMGAPVVVVRGVSRFADEPPMLVSWGPTEKTADAYVTRIEGLWPVYIPKPADLPIQPPVVLEYQHAALRWERVARRWAGKHGPWTVLDIAGAWGDWFARTLAPFVERLARSNPLLSDKPKEPTP